MPLTDLTKKGVPNVIISRWSGYCQEAYDRLKAELLSAQMLKILTTGTPFHLYFDVSKKAVEATLGQLDKQGVEQPLAFASQKLCDTQMGWFTFEREAYAVIRALNRFRDLIFGYRVSIFCGHNPLQYIRECAPKSAKLLSWSLAFQEFDFGVPL